ncbi:hypothetical protein [Methylobacter tundripaludum]|nr:hypothetical protein [Methylobacter tundripaludum]
MRIIRAIALTAAVTPLCTETTTAKDRTIMITAIGAFHILPITISTISGPIAPQLIREIVGRAKIMIIPLTTETITVMTLTAGIVINALPINKRLARNSAV